MKEYNVPALCQTDNSYPEREKDVATYRADSFYRAVIGAALDEGVENILWSHSKITRHLTREEIERIRSMTPDELMVAWEERVQL